MALASPSSGLLARDRSMARSVGALARERLGVKRAHDDASIGGVSCLQTVRILPTAQGPRPSIMMKRRRIPARRLLQPSLTERPGSFVSCPQRGAHQYPSACRVARRHAWVDATHIVFERESGDFKKRTIYVAEIAAELPLSRTKMSRRSSGVFRKRRRCRPGITRRALDRVPQRPRRLGPSLRGGRGRRRGSANHQRALRSVAPAVVARQHPHRL